MPQYFLDPMPTRTDLLKDLRLIQKRLNEIFVEPHLGFGSSAEPSNTAGYWAPVADCYETQDKYVIIAEVPGVSREDIDLKAQPQKLILTGKRKPSRELPTESCHRMECASGKFQRVFEFSSEIDTGHIQAGMNNGVIRVTVPKRGASFKRIPIENPE